MVLYPARVLKPRLLGLIRLALAVTLYLFHLVNDLWRLTAGLRSHVRALSLSCGHATGRIRRLGSSLFPRFNNFRRLGHCQGF